MDELLTSLRIIGGRFKNHPLKSPSGSLTRPTMSLMRKAVFDICQMQIEGAHFLDLFACSGAMGIEALSRGAHHSTFIEKDRRTVQTLQENLKNLGLMAQSTVLIGDVFSMVPRLNPDLLIDLIYIDPPYPFMEDPKKPILSLLQLLEQKAPTTSQTILFLEERAPGGIHSCLESLTQFTLKNSRRFGGSILHQLIVASS